MYQEYSNMQTTKSHYCIWDELHSPIFLLESVLDIFGKKSLSLKDPPSFSSCIISKTQKNKVRKEGLHYVADLWSNCTFLCPFLYSSTKKWLITNPTHLFSRFLLKMFGIIRNHAIPPREFFSVIFYRKQPAATIKTKGVGFKWCKSLSNLSM